MLRRRDALWSYDVSDGVDIADDTSIDGMGGKLEWWVTGDLAPGTLAGYEQADEGVGRGPGGPPHLRKAGWELFDGIKTVAAHNAAGHPAYLLGERRQFGWWYYYPVVLAVKTPLPFLALLFIGLAVSLSKVNRAKAAYWLPLAFSLGIFFVSCFSHINIGVRHILPVYLGFSVTAAVGAVWLSRQSFTARWALWID